MDEKKYTVYFHRNKINNKAYIGITSVKPEKRFGCNGYNYKKNEYFWRSIQKYGWDNFEHIIFAEGLAKKRAAEIERLLIALYDTTNPEHGYNHSTGGEGGAAGCHYSDEVCQKWSDIRSKTVCQYDKKGNLIKIWESIKDASKTLLIDSGCITKCCKGVLKTYKGFIWQYYKEVI